MDQIVRPKTKPMLLQPYGINEGWSRLVSVPTKSNVAVIGIDTSLTATGVAILYKGRIKTLLLSPPKDMKGASRLRWFYGKFQDVLKEYSPAYCCVEGYATKAVGLPYQIGELGGVLRLVLHEQGITYAEIPPTSLKLFAAGSGKADKEQVSKELYKRYLIDLNNNNEVDASGLALVALALCDAEFVLLSHQRAALEKLKSGFVTRIKIRRRVRV